MLIQYTKKYSKYIVGQLFFASIWVISQLLIPRFMVEIVDSGIMMKDMNAIVYRGLLMLLATVLNIVSLLISLYFLTKATAGISRDLRSDLFEKIIDWSKETRTGFSDSTLITRTVNDVKQVSTFLDLSLRKIFTLTITVIGSLVLSFSLDVQLASVILIIIPLILLLGLFLTSKALPQYARIRLSIDRINQMFRENISGIRVIRAFNKADYEIREFEKATKEASEASIASESTMMLLSPLILLLTNILILIILYLSGMRAQAGAIKLGVLIGLIEYATISLTNIQQFASIITIIPRSKVSIDRIAEVLSREEVLKRKEGVFESCEEGIRFQEVDFYYPSSRIAALKEIHFYLRKGQTKAIIGSTGSGKSTILKLLLRDYDAYRGKICLNGMSITCLSREEINQAITFIPQSAFLFSGSIRENIQTGKKDATDEEIWQVLNMVQMGDFFRESPDGLDTHIAQNAVNFSGGQKQRISIARGLIRESDFYIFDDCFSALDYATEKKIREAIQEKLADRGVLVVAQRVASVRGADEILVLENGSIVDRGTHEELKVSSEVYKEILASQSKSREGGLK
ncbi:MAG: ABC transporter ATP-binding protein [Tissierellia bacterium]|nr:ABC transporter ATP-binding protein [Bacillota bacterium]NLL22903.1 ABC transporter ATP-binding protein [Tissierellia bacterium]